MLTPGCICILHEIMEWFLNLSYWSLVAVIELSSLWCFPFFMRSFYFRMWKERLVISCLLGIEHLCEFTLPFWAAKLSACPTVPLFCFLELLWPSLMVFLFMHLKPKQFTPLTVTDSTGFCLTFVLKWMLYFYQSTCSSIGSGAANPRDDAQK